MVRIYFIKPSKMKKKLTLRVLPIIALILFGGIFLLTDKNTDRENYEDFINDARIQLQWFLNEVEQIVKKLGGEYHG